MQTTTIRRVCKYSFLARRYRTSNLDLQPCTFVKPADQAGRPIGSDAQHPIHNSGMDDFHRASPAIGGPRALEYDWVYQIAASRCPDEKGRSCLNGTRKRWRRRMTGQRKSSTSPAFKCLNGHLSAKNLKNCSPFERTARGPAFRCIKLDMTDLPTPCAAQMEEVDSSKEEGSSTSAGTSILKSSTVRPKSGVNVDVEA